MKLIGIQIQLSKTNGVLLVDLDDLHKLTEQCINAMLIAHPDFARIIDKGLCDNPDANEMFLSIMLANKRRKNHEGHSTCIPWDCLESVIDLYSFLPYTNDKKVFPNDLTEDERISLQKRVIRAMWRLEHPKMKLIKRVDY